MNLVGMLSLDELFEGRHFDREIIVLCVRRYLRYKLSFRDLVEMMAERGPWRTPRSCVGSNAMSRNSKGAGTASLARQGWSWRVDETYVKIKGRWIYLYRAVDKEGKDRRFPAARQAGRRSRQGVLPASFQRPRQTAP
jgi:transposase-like protein